MAVDRRGHTATLLPNGKILVTGGRPNCPKSAELYDPVANLWTSAGMMAAGRCAHTATLLTTGKVLLVGGSNSDGDLVDLYDPATNTWAAAPSYASQVEGHTATLLSNGKVLVAGGRSAGNLLAVVMLYDPTSGVWQPAAPLPAARADQTATLLANGKVLLVEGSNPGAQLYDPATDAWSVAGALADWRTSHASVLLPGGQVLITGGTSSNVNAFASVELFDPATNTWTLGGPMLAARKSHTATLLSSGKVLVVGGTGGLGAEIYTPALGITCLTASDCSASQPHCVAGLCCTSACDGGCENCALPGRIGTCTPRAAGHTGAPSCAPYVCPGGAGACPTSCTDDMDCTATHFCWSGACALNGTGTAGVACRASNQCVSGSCVDGVCCDTSCGNPCTSCNLAGREGTCAPDPATTPDETCNGFRCGPPDAGCLAQCAANDDCLSTHRCVDAGCVDRLPLGSPCTSPGDCLWGSCSRGFCCASDCYFACATCPAPDFECKIAPVGYDGGFGCAPYACSGFSESCPNYCVEDAGCAPGHFCSEGARCLATGTGGNGTPCTTWEQCASGQCADGVCCDTACANSDPTDCQACSVDAGAPGNGFCKAVASGTVCRAGLILDGGLAAPCDGPERCTGATLACPPPAFLAPGTECRAVNGACDAPEMCTGTSPFCPDIDLRRDSSVVCRPAAGACDVADQCDGLSADCPPDVLRDAGLVCRGAQDACDVAEACSGLASGCPIDLAVPDGTPCGSAFACLSGACAAVVGGGAGGSGGSGAGGGSVPPADAGTMTQPPRGCGCSGTAGAHSALGLLALGWLRRRLRTRQRPRRC